MVWWLLLLAGSVLLAFMSGAGERQRAPRDRSTGLAPDPATFRPAVVQVYAARTLGTKGNISVHTWIGVKRTGAETYTRYEIIGWRLRRAGSALSIRRGMPDQPWYGNPPELLLDRRGPEVDALIDSIEEAVAAYPFSNTYSLWPGPNSNTFPAYVGRAVPELGLDLPTTAIGKDYRPLAEFLGASPSGSGIQASLWGVAGVALGFEEGLEINLLGLNVELDLFDLALELPALGRFGPAPTPVGP